MRLSPLKNYQRLLLLSRTYQAGLVQGIGDDAALFKTTTGFEQVICVDTMVEGVHFRKDTWHFIMTAHKALECVTDLMGVACGNAFGLAMMFFSLRTIETSHAARLSGMAQSLGYLLAAVGPVLFGIVYELFHSWSAPLLILVTAKRSDEDECTVIYGRCFESG